MLSLRPFIGWPLFYVPHFFILVNNTLLLPILRELGRQAFALFLGQLHLISFRFR